MRAKIFLYEISIIITPMLNANISEIKNNRLSMMVLVCNPTYSGDRGGVILV
jgi:hypothetical protein